jgi:uncharacterized protein with FMN-binding domain
MRRVLLALSGTVAGLIMLLSFKSHPASTAAAGVGAGGAGSPAAAGAGGSAAGGSGAGSVTGSGQVASGAGGSGTGGSGRQPAGSGAGSGSGGTAVATGQAVSTAYGPMQVQATLIGGRITAVKVLQQTNLGSLSQQIDASAIPQLTQEALTAQSARIHAVSGASYTSAGYIQSLQSALDKARS